ncbi:hypothetical protein GMLC_11990 [Geomonas limicola]|uniref:Uncharacterized protein n=1 Tax=Geomonas limicola TaxID=2740186 RepID=A0A6V8N5G1_9BACT|nr:hypothetical protein [Geomonas limicola]GFO67620.1 hypothetical protein GMLC_11990 [Geomonas limicola]
MADTTRYQKIAKTIKIFAMAQGALILMLVYMAVQFQAKFQALGIPGRFMNAVVASFVIQMVLFYPIYRFASKEVERDLAMSTSNLSSEELKAYTKKKRMGDIVKVSVFFFFGMFILQAPSIPIVLSVLYFSFVLTVLSYLQCYNFAAKKLMRQ